MNDTKKATPGGAPDDRRTLAYAEKAIAVLGDSPEAAEGRAAFGEKRKPGWAAILPNGG